MATANLTAASVLRLPFAPPSAATRWCVYWDMKLRGLGLRITESGVRCYVVRYRLRGTRAQRLKTLGNTSVLTLPQARERAKEVLRLAERGEDWFETVLRDRSHTVADLWTYYQTNHLADPGISPRTRTEAASLWKRHCEKKFQNKAAVDITPEQARDWHKQVTKSGPYVANRAAQLMRALWNYGIKFGLVPKGTGNPFTSLELNKEMARKVILQPQDLPKLAKAIDKTGDPVARAYLWMLFYTGARRSELLTLHWTDVDAGAGRITFRNTKGGEPRVVELSPPAKAILKSIPRTDNPYVFAGAKEGTHLDPKKPWQRARKAAKLPDLRLHDLRRSFGSWLGASGYTSKQIGTLLGHKTDITSRVYIQLGEDHGLKRELSNAFARIATRHRKVKRRAAVIPIRTRA